MDHKAHLRIQRRRIDDDDAVLVGGPQSTLDHREIADRIERPTDEDHVVALRGPCAFWNKGIIYWIKNVLKRLDDRVLLSRETTLGSKESAKLEPSLSLMQKHNHVIALGGPCAVWNMGII